MDTFQSEEGDGGLMGIDLISFLKDELDYNQIKVKKQNLTKFQYLCEHQDDGVKVN